MSREGERWIGFLLSLILVMVIMIAFGVVVIERHIQDIAEALATL